MAGTGFFSGSSIQGRVKNWLLMVFRWSSACLWNSINKYFKASFFHAPHFIYFHSMNLTSQSARRDGLLRWLSCSKIICNKKVIILLLYKKTDVRKYRPTKLRKNKKENRFRFFFQLSPHRNVVLYVEYLINADLNYPELFKSSCHTVGFIYPYSMFCPADGCIQSLNVQNFPILLHS